MFKLLVPLSCLFSMDTQMWRQLSVLQRCVTLILVSFAVGFLLIFQTSTAHNAVENLPAALDASLTVKEAARNTNNIQNDIDKLKKDNTRLKDLLALRHRVFKRRREGPSNVGDLQVHNPLPQAQEQEEGRDAIAQGQLKLQKQQEMLAELKRQQEELHHQHEVIQHEMQQQRQQNVQDYGLHVQHNAPQHQDEYQEQGGGAVLPAVEESRVFGPKNDQQRAIVEAMRWAWQGYKQYAWGHDELLPISKTSSEWFRLGLTIVDSLDTLFIMGMVTEFAEARSWVADHMQLDQDVEVNLFETTIRVLGGLLSTYHLSNDKIFLDRAVSRYLKF